MHCFAMHRSSAGIQARYYEDAVAMRKGSLLWILLEKVEHERSVCIHSGADSYLLRMKLR
jgi:hypothetical protein